MLTVVDDAPIVPVFAPTDVVTGLVDVVLVSNFALVVVVADAVVVNFAVDCAFALPFPVCADFAPPATVDCFALVSLAAEVVAAVTTVVVVFALMAVSDDFALDLVAGFEMTVLFVDDMLFSVVVAFALVVRTVLVTAAGCWVFAPTGNVAGFALQWTLASTTLFVDDVFALQVASTVWLVTLVTGLQLSPVFATLTVAATFCPFSRLAFSAFVVVVVVTLDVLVAESLDAGLVVAPDCATEVSTVS